MSRITRWCRVEFDGEACHGRLNNDRIEIHAGDMFNRPTFTGKVIDVDDARWLPPVKPRQFLGLWNNFHERQQAEKTRIPEFPLYFVKLADSLSAHRCDIRRPLDLNGDVKFEAELGIVIGRESHRLQAQEVDAAIFGYTCVNDVTAPQVLFGNPEFPQWCRAKSYSGFGPVGPVVACGVEPDALRIRGILDGEVKQDYPVSDMIFSPREIVRLISQEITLYPGDLIACGTSVGAASMQPGQVIEVEIPGISTLSNRLSI